MYAIETVNPHYFVDIGGLSVIDLSFELDNYKNFPLIIAAAKGSAEFVKLMLENKFLDINQKNELNLNAFWIAARYGHGSVMKVLAENGIDIFCTDDK